MILLLFMFLLHVDQNDAGRRHCSCHCCCCCCHSFARMQLVRLKIASCRAKCHAPDPSASPATAPSLAALWGRVANLLIAHQPILTWHKSIAYQFKLPRPPARQPANSPTRQQLSQQFELAFKLRAGGAGAPRHHGVVIVAFGSRSTHADDVVQLHEVHSNYIRPKQPLRDCQIYI